MESGQAESRDIHTRDNLIEEIFMKINNAFGKLLQDGSLQYAPESFNYNGKDYIHPTPAEFKMVGMLPIVTVQPS